METLLQRFTQKMADCRVPGAGSVGVALSGGTDSLALAILAAFWAREGDFLATRQYKQDQSLSKWKL